MIEYVFRMCNIKYPIFYTETLQDVAQYILKEKENDNVVLVHDNALDFNSVSEIRNIISKSKECNLIGVSIDETTKDLDMVNHVIERMIEYKATRKTVVVAIGGGVLGNVVGMAAGLIFRGIKLIHVPTTIVAATDSILSIKQAVNMKYGKNLVGMFYSQHSVVVCYQFFKTLPRREYHAGLAETVKNLLAIIPEHIQEFQDKMGTINYDYRELLYLFEISLKAKQKVLIDDIYEKKDGLVLEYGHTVGHAIEIISKGEIRHGEGVAFGMLVMAEISNELGMLSDHEVDMHYRLLNTINILYSLKGINNYSSSEVAEIMKYDNKRGYLKNEDSISLVLLRSLGESCTSNNIKLYSVDIELIINKIDSVKYKIQRYYNSYVS